MGNIPENVWLFKLLFCGRGEGIVSNLGSDYLTKFFIRAHGAPGNDFKWGLFMFSYDGGMQNKKHLRTEPLCMAD